VHLHRHGLEVPQRMQALVIAQPQQVGLLALQRGVQRLLVAVGVQRGAIVFNIAMRADVVLHVLAVAQQEGRLQVGGREGLAAALRVGRDHRQGAGSARLCVVAQPGQQERLVFPHTLQQGFRQRALRRTERHLSTIVQRQPRAVPRQLGQQRGQPLHGVLVHNCHVCMSFIGLGAWHAAGAITCCKASCR
jgi:hypothetical protein